jgi:hypothetical protein
LCIQKAGTVIETIRKKKKEKAELGAWKVKIKKLTAINKASTWD